MKKWLMTVACASMLLVPTTSYAFSDVAKGMYYEKPIEWAAEQKIVSGYEDNTFKPKAQVTFDQFIKMYTNSFPFEKNGATSYEDFYDVLNNYNIDFWIKPKHISRGDVAVLFAYAAGALSGDLSSASLQTYYEEAAQYMLDSKLSTGQNNGKTAAEIFGVHNPLTRGQAVTFLHRANEMDLLHLDEEIQYIYEAPPFTEQERVLRSYNMSEKVTYHVLSHDDAVANYEVQIVLDNRVVGGYYAVPNTTFLGYKIGKKKQEQVIAPVYYTVTPHVDQYNDDEVRAVSYKHVSYKDNEEVQQALDVTTFENADLVGQLYADLANEFRVKNNMEQLQAHTVLTKAAQLHSIDMAKQNYFSHTALSGLSHRDRIEQIDSTLQLKATGENISAGRSTIFEAHTGWINSSGHRANMLSPLYRKIGFGAGYDASSQYKRYYTTKFANM